MPVTNPPGGRSKRLVILVLALLLAALLWTVRWWKTSSGGPSRANPTNALQLLVDFEASQAKRYWQPEMDARKRGRVVEDLWDHINEATNKLSLLSRELMPGEVLLPVLASERVAPHQVHLFSGSSIRKLDSESWRALLANAMESGWELAACEARFIGVAPDTFYFSAHLVNRRTDTRAILEGNVIIEFGGAEPPFHRLDASGLQLRTRAGPLPFSEMFHAEVPPHPGSFFIDPLIVWDLDRDEQLEVILAAANVVIRRDREGRWRPDLLCANDPGLIFSAILGDFNGDGATDFLSAGFEGLRLFEGTPDGTFPKPGRTVWAAQPHLRYAQTLTAGDLDGDGDLDLFLGQYKLPYDKGQMPFPYYDANDGFPSFLLTNDGKGNFSDQTQAAGLGAKRGRRVYSASLADLDFDGDLDLLLVSDFAGLDVFKNDGTGHFSDATREWFDETHAFGMAHVLSDFNRDGRLDLLMIGMNSPTADRLQSLNLHRPYERDDSGMRQAVTFGNRLFFGQPNGTFRQNKLSAQVARTGWSWGAAAGDLDNDGFPDLYIANGHDSRASVREYEPEFWLHDIYIGTSQENYLAEAYFRQKFARTRGTGYSYGGHEKNRLFLNEHGTNFIEVAHLFGVALEPDCRNLAFQDLDGDAKPDLIVTTFETYPETRQRIQFFRNTLVSQGNSLKIALSNSRNAGATARVVTDRTNAFTALAGESYRTQLPPVFQLGIGSGAAANARLLQQSNLFQIRENR